MVAQVSGGDSQVGSRATRRLGATLGAQRPHGCGFASQEELACLTHVPEVWHSHWRGTQLMATALCPETALWWQAGSPRWGVGPCE